MSTVNKYRQRPVEIDAMLMSGYGDFIRARDWINDNGGTAYAMSDGKTDKVTIITIDGNIADVFEGWYVVRGVGGEFYPCRGDIFEASHEAVKVSEAEALTGTGLFQDHKPDARKTLVGGAALKLDREFA